MEMELCVPLFSLFFLSLAVVLFVQKKCKTSTDPKTAKPPLPPGSLGWPLVGETLTYFSMARKGLQYRFIAERVTKHSSTNIFKTSLLGETMAVMCTPEGNKFLFSNENKLVQVWWPSSIQNIFYGDSKSFNESTKQLRKLVVPSFLKPQSLQNDVHVLDSLTRRHMRQHWRGGQVVRVQELARRHAFRVACRLFLSIKDDDDGMVASLEKHVVDIGIGMISFPVNLPGTRYRRAVRAARSFCREVLGILKMRRENTNIRMVGEQDLLSFFMSYEDENGELFSEVDISEKVLSFMFTAHETTTGTIVAIVNYLSELPHVYDAVRREQMEIAKSKGEGELLNWEDIQKMTYSWNVVRETLRFVPPIFGGFKEAITDFTYKGFFIPKGWKLHWNMFATHKNPKYFPDPEKFDPSRFDGNGPTPYSYIPFGGGARMCPGYEFARLEILVFMHNLVTKYKFEKVFPDEKIVSDPSPAPTRGLPIRLYPH